METLIPAKTASSFFALVHWQKSLTGWKNVGLFCVFFFLHWHKGNDADENLNPEITKHSVDVCFFFGLKKSHLILSSRVVVSEQFFVRSFFPLILILLANLNEK